MDIPPRVIIRESEFEEQLARLIPYEPDADEFTMAAEDTLTHEPEIGMPLSKDGEIRILPMPPVRGIRVSLYYSFDDQTVVFRSILAFDD